jgi:hydrophobe/amphiphile efflux-3 (HAE3) family protein
VDGFARFVVKRAPWLLAGIAAVTLLALSAVLDLRSGEARLGIDPSVNSLLPEEDESRRFYDYVRRVFGSDETLVIALSHPESIFSAGNLRRVQRITERIEEMEGIHHAVSIANALNLRSAEGDLVIEPFLEVIPDDPGALEALREQALGNPLFAGNLISWDTKSAAVIVTLLDLPESEFLERELGRELLQIAREEAGTLEVLLTGSLHVKAEMSRTLLSDLNRILPLTLLVAALIAFLSFRSLRAVAVPITTILVALIWTLGLVSASGYELNLVTIVVPPLILVIGFAYAIHVVSAYYEAAHGDGVVEEGGIVAAALRQVLLPTFLTGATTAAGFLSLTTSPLGAIKQFGVFSTIGVLATMLAAVTLAPALLQVLPAPRTHGTKRKRGRIDDLLIRLADFDIRNRATIIAAGGIVAGIALLAMTRIEVSTDFITSFPVNSAVRRDFERINQLFAGSGTVNVVLQTDYRDAFKEPVNLRRVRELQEWLVAQPEIGSTTSLVDYLMLINRGFHDGDPAFLSIPESKRLITQLLFFAANDEIESFADSGYRTLNVLTRTNVVDSGDMVALADRIEDHLASLPQHIQGRVTGNTVLVARTIDEIAWGQALSLLSAFVIIFVILALLFTSARVGAIALIPNALPVIAYFGILGLSGVYLNTTTGLVACLVLGIAVDDTIHYLSHFNSEARRLADERKGVIGALRHVGRPITYTSIALCLGFLVLVTAQMRSQVEFGVLAAVTLAFAWLVDVTFTPALAARMRIVTLWEVMALDLGEAPQRSIPVFRGLSATQARIAALMTSIRTYPQGHRLMRMGEEGDALYIVIDGVLAATAPGEKGPVQLSTAKRGDVVGEVGLIQGKRSADVEALTDVRLIRLTSRNLDRLKRRYPRTGAQIYENLSRILADRLVRATERLR